MTNIPGKPVSRRRFTTVRAGERRAILRAVNRGKAVDDRRQARFAVGVARQQQRFWRFAWLLGPALGAVQMAFMDVEVALANTATSTLVLGLVCWFWYRRARRSELANRQLLETRSGRRSSHVPSSRRDDRDRARTNDGGAALDVAAAPRPPRPRGRKRR